MAKYTWLQIFWNSNSSLSEDPFIFNKLGIAREGVQSPEKKSMGTYLNVYFGGKGRRTKEGFRGGVITNTGHRGSGSLKTWEKRIFTGI
jgi:hypothetical protein